MQTRIVGDSLLAVTIAGLGCNNFGTRIDEAESRRVVAAALDGGIRFFDTADVYGDGRSEEFLGRALGERRTEVVIATKFGLKTSRPDCSQPWIMRAAEDSLRRLATDFIDLYLLHRPSEATPIDEMLETLDRLVQQGKVRWIGCCNASGSDIERAGELACELGSARFVCIQNEWNLLAPRGGNEPSWPCLRRGLGIIPHSPLAGGLLSGKYRHGQPLPASSRLVAMPHLIPNDFQARMAAVERIAALADELGRTMLELALGWLAGQALVPTIIAGAATPTQVRANAAATAVELDAHELAAIGQVLDG